MAFASLPGITVDQTEKELHVLLQLFQALRFSFRLTVTDPDQRQHRRDILQRQRVRILCADLACGDQRTEDPGVIAQEAVPLPFGIERRQFR